MMLVLLQNVFLLLLISGAADGQTAAVPPAQVVKRALDFGLQDGTPVKLRTTRTLSSKDSKTGDTVDFEVLEDVKAGDIVIIPRGGVALGTVTRAKPKGRMGKGGKLDITIDSVRLVSGEKVALRAVKETKGGSSTGMMTGAMVATGILFFPAAPFFLFMKGKDITIPKGTEIAAYVNGDAALDRSKFIAAQTDSNALMTSAEATAAQASQASVKSDPDGAEIWVDGSFVGSTPSTLPLKPGDHAISLKKTGYLAWERTITMNAGGNITINAELEKTP